MKGRLVANGSVQRGKFNKSETASPCVGLDDLIVTTVVDALERRDVATIDLPSAYISARQPEGEVVHMVIRGKLAELMVEAEPTTYRKYLTVDRNGNAVLYVKIARALYGLIKSALLFYRKLLTDLIRRGFKVNPYDPCVANKIINGTQMTIC